MVPLTAVPHAPARPQTDPVAGALGQAFGVRAAARVVVEHLAAHGLLPSFYLEQGGRLRCQATRGYRQIFDGMPPSAGVIGRTFSSGQPVATLDARRSADYLEAAPAVVAEVCVPVWVRGRVVGALNAESRTPTATPEADEVMRCAALLGERLADFGDLDVPSPAQLLARAGARLAALSDPADIAAAAAQAACELSGCDSVALAVADVPGDPLRVTYAAGSFAPQLAALTPGELASVAAWVDAGASSYSIDDPEGVSSAGHDAIPSAAGGALVVLPLAAAGERLGILVLVDGEPRALGATDVELLETLAIQAAAGLRTAAAVAELRHRAAHDPLTGLGHHATFGSALPALRAAAATGTAVAVLLADVDGFKGINDRLGHAAGDTILRRVAGQLQFSAPAGAAAYRIGGDEFAVLAPVAGEADALALGQRLAAAVREGVGVTLSMGVASARTGEADADLRDRADAAVYAVKRAGRNGVALG